MIVLRFTGMHFISNFLMFGLHLKQTIHNEGFKVCEYGFHFQINSIWVYISIRLGLVMGLMHIGMDFISKN